MVAKVVGISVPQELLEKIDTQRGDISRSKYILRLIEEGYRQREKKSR
jgi:metal-responsive CopG/Arc/MetJ family transcriptional regulator